MMSQQCLKGFIRVFQVYFKYISMVLLGFQGYYKGSSRLSQVCLQSLSKVSQGWLKGVSRMFMGFSNTHEGCSKLNATWYMEFKLDLYSLFYKMVALLFLEFLGKLNHDLNFGSGSSLTNDESQSQNKKIRKILWI